jgi:hypothetical protein
LRSQCPQVDGLIVAPYVTFEHKFENPSRVPCVFSSPKTASLSMPWRCERSAIEPICIRATQAAFYKACAQLGRSPTPDHITEILVTKIIDLCTAGGCDPDRLSEIVVAYFRASEAKDPGDVQ